jgi:hypothetical protein
MLNPTQVYVNVTQVEARAYADALHAAALADARAALKENQQLQRELQQKEVRTSIEIPIEALWSLNGPFGNLTELPIELPVQLEALGGKLQQGFAASQDSLLVEVQSTLAQMGRETKQTTDHELKASLTALKLALQEELGSVRREMAQQVNILFNCSYCEYPLPVSHSKAVVLLTKSRIVAGDARRTRDAREGTGGAGGGAQAADEGAGGAADGTGHTAYGVEV